MAAIWSDIEIQFQGETYTVRPTMQFLNYIEQIEGCSLSKMLIRMTQQDLPSGLACELIARTLTYAGRKTTGEEVFAETSGIGAEVVTLAGAIIVGCMPTPKTMQNSVPSSSKKKALPRK